MDRNLIASELLLAAKEVSGGLYFEPKQLDWDKMRFREDKTWVYHFKGGGWNSSVARTKKQALAKAIKRWKVESPELVKQIDEKSFRVPTREEYNSLLRQFN
jgi:hypothetical protein